MFQICAGEHFSSCENIVCVCVLQINASCLPETSVCVLFTLAVDFAVQPICCLGKSSFPVVFLFPQSRAAMQIYLLSVFFFSSPHLILYL